MLRPFLVSALTAAALALPGIAAADVSGPAIVDFVNAQRAGHGLPAGIVEDPTLSDGCARHNRYGSANRILAHDETEGRPGYSPQGRDAARSSVLYRGGGAWAATRNPFEEAPIHLHQLLAPRLDRVGAAETGDYGCATTLASLNRSAPETDVSYSYPRDRARGWPAAQTAAEAPYTPGSRVGIPAGTRTGPYLYVLFDGPDLSTRAEARVTEATLIGPDGPVALARADNTTPGLENLLPTGAELIPRRPLRATATYTASVTATVSDDGVAPRTFSRTWSFTTGAPPITGRPQTSGAFGSRRGAPGMTRSATDSGTRTSSAQRNDRTSAGRWFRLGAKVVRRGRRELRVRVSCSSACGVVASGTVRAAGRTVRRGSRTVRVRGRTMRLRTTRTMLSRRGGRTLRFQIAKRGARSRGARGRRTLRLRVSGAHANAKDHRRIVTLRLRA